MPPRKSALPEGTDHIVRGASAEDETGAGGTGSGGGAGASSSGEGNGGFAATRDKLVDQVRDQVSSLRDQAGSRARGFADEGKAKATSLLDDVSEVIDEAAQAVDRKFGGDYGEYAHRASAAVSGFADRVRTKTVDDLIDDTRDFVRKSPGIAIGIAAVAGFMLVRLVKTGLDEISTGRAAANDGA